MPDSRVPSVTAALTGDDSGLFGVPQEELVAGLRAIGDAICGYGPRGTYPRVCDCKYGATRRGEDTGCPEIASALLLVKAMTPAEYGRIAKRAKVDVIE